VALRSVVLTPPAGMGGPRRTVVLRPGGPRDKGRAADIIAGIVGVILLLSCLLLVQVLPHKDYAMPQFKVAFPDTLHDADFPTQGFNFTETEAGHIHDFSFALPENTQSLSLVVFMKDDVPGSLPDQFRIELFDPAHQPVLKQDIMNADPRLNSSQQANGFVYDAGEYNGRIPYTVGPHPNEQVVQGLARNEVKEQALARLEPQARIHSAGAWVVRVTLIQAQDCPQPTPGEFPPNPQTVFCRVPPNGPQDGSDNGNRLTLNIAFSTYKAEIEQLS
jgi:hypothetical protein